MLSQVSPILGQTRAKLLIIAKSFVHVGHGQGRTFGILPEVVPILGQVRAELFAVCEKFCPYCAEPWQNFLCVVKKFCPSFAIPRPYGQNFCPSSARPGRKFQYKGKSFARLGPGQGRSFGLVPGVLPILGQARAELLVYCKNFCPFWARPGRNF